MAPGRTPKSVRQLVDQQVLEWKRRGDQTAAADQPRRIWPAITVSREFGALGAQLAERLAVGLGFSFWDRQILTTIAEQTGMHETVLRSLDESASSRLEDFFAEALQGRLASADGFMWKVAEVIHTVGLHGSAVIVGRGAEFILAADQALRVRVVSPLPRRVANYALRAAVSHEQAAQTIKRMDKERARFVRQQFHADVTDPHAHDLVVNLDVLDADDAQAIIFAAYEARFGSLPTLPS